MAAYHGWPLYTYLGDAAPGHVDGQAQMTTAATGT
jgi:predicted lipoprotein with Yx(FWY)xxD motif